MNYIYLFIIVGLGLTLFSVFNLGLAYAQEESGASSLEITFSIISTIVGMIIVLIPVIRREMIARNIQDPAITKALDQADILAQKYLNDQEKFLQMGEILYTGLSKFEQGKEFVDHIENKEKVKLAEMEKDLKEAEIEYRKFLDLYSSIRPKLKD